MLTYSCLHQVSNRFRMGDLAKQLYDLEVGTVAALCAGPTDSRTPLAACHRENREEAARVGEGDFPLQSKGGGIRPEDRGGAPTFALLSSFHLSLIPR